MKLDWLVCSIITDSSLCQLLLLSEVPKVQHMRVLKDTSYWGLHKPSVCVDPQREAASAADGISMGFCSSHSHLCPSGWWVQLVPTQPERKQLFIERAKAPTWLLEAVQVEEFYPKVTYWASEVRSLWDEEDTLFPPALCHPLCLSSINRFSPALSLPLPSGWETQLRNSETTACHPLQSLARSCFCLYSPFMKYSAYFMGGDLDLQSPMCPPADQRRWECGRLKGSLIKWIFFFSPI